MFGLGMLEMLLGTAVLLVIATVLIRVLGQTVGGVVAQRSAPEQDLAAIAERTARLEESLIDMNEKLSRLAEGQEFTTKVLLERKK